VEHTWELAKHCPGYTCFLTIADDPQSQASGAWTGGNNIYIPPAFPTAYNYYYGYVEPVGDVWHFTHSRDGVISCFEGLATDYEFQCESAGDVVIELMDIELEVLDTLTIHQVEPPPGDFDADGDEDGDDLRVLALAWMSKSGDDNWNPDCDISDPNDEVIDGQDFGVFANYWEGTGGAAKAGISYQIEDCDLGAKMAGPDKNGLRFSATVDGNYIFFEDMMEANCCATEVRLEMMVENNLITLYELEYTPMPCYCICDWPVTATLGPFNTGTYTLEVYEEGWGGFIGSTIVTIE